MKTNFSISLMFGLLFSLNLFADSPLTSTPFYKAYRGVDIVQIALSSRGRITDEVMDYLIESRHPIELKIAAINALEWDSDGRYNANTFYKYLRYNTDLRDIKYASAEILICYAYLKAMDDYFDVEDALNYAKEAKSKNTGKSYTINIICALIEAQNEPSNGGCRMWKLTDNVRRNKLLNKDMKSQAIDIIFDYMDGFRKSCDAEIIMTKNSNGTFTMPCVVNGLKMKFIFDSGASDVTISLAEALFMLKNDYLSENNIIGKEYYQIANGDIEEGTKIILDSINIGGHIINDVEASIVHSLDAPLLLGQSALSRLGKYSFDYSNNSLIIGN